MTKQFCCKVTTTHNWFYHSTFNFIPIISTFFVISFCKPFYFFRYLTCLTWHAGAHYFVGKWMLCRFRLPLCLKYWAVMQTSDLPSLGCRNTSLPKLWWPCSFPVPRASQQPLIMITIHILWLVDYQETDRWCVQAHYYIYWAVYWILSFIWGCCESRVDACSRVPD